MANTLAVAIMAIPYGCSIKGDPSSGGSANVDRSGDIVGVLVSGKTSTTSTYTIGSNKDVYFMEHCTNQQL